MKMKATDKMRAIAIFSWVAGGFISLGDSPVVGALSVFSGALFMTSLLVDVADANEDGVWHRKGYFYVAQVNYVTPQYKGTITRKLGFVTYHLIRRIHGDQVLRDMALRIDK